MPKGHAAGVAVHHVGPPRGDANRLATTCAKVVWRGPGRGYCEPVNTKSRCRSDAHSRIQTGPRAMQGLKRVRQRDTASLDNAAQPMPRSKPLSLASRLARHRVMTTSPNCRAIVQYRRVVVAVLSATPPASKVRKLVMKLRADPKFWPMPSSRAAGDAALERIGGFRAGPRHGRHRPARCSGRQTST